MIGHLGGKTIKVNRIKNDNQGRILIVNADIDEETFVLINLYNANTEMQQIKTVCELDQLLCGFFLDSNKRNSNWRGIFVCSSICSPFTLSKISKQSALKSPESLFLIIVAKLVNM